MKYILILTAILFLSCKDNVTSTKNGDAEIATNEMANILTEPVEHIYEEEVKSKENVQNSSYLKSYLYKGTLNGKHNITLYITAHENPCGGGSDAAYFNAMYKYDNQEQWILLNVTTDIQRNTFCMVEGWFTGTLFLIKNGKTFNGKWISPDTEKQYNVNLLNQLLDKNSEFDKAVIENLDNTLFDDLLYNKNDC